MSAMERAGRHPEAPAADERPPTRRASRSRIAVVSLLLLCVVSAAACGDDNSNGGSSSNGTPATSEKPPLTIGLNADFANLNPAKDQAGTTQMVRALTNAPLVHINPDGSLSGGGLALAESYRYVGEGNRTFELTLRPDAQFSDGTPVDAAAVKKWLTYFPTENGPYVEQLEIDTIETPDERTVVLNLAGANPNVPWILSEVLNWGAVSSPKGVDKPKSLSTTTAGAGPYVLVPSETVAGDHYTLEPSKHYWDQDAIKFSKITVRVITNPSTMLQAFKTGQVDVAVGKAETAPAAESAGTVVSNPFSWNGIVIMDRAGELLEPLGDVRVRQALNYAIDREAITKGLFGDYGQPSSAVLSRDGFDSELQDFYPYDPEKARALLAEAGYPDGFTMHVAAASFADDTKNAQAMAKYLGEVGVKLEIVSISNPAQYVDKAMGGDVPALQTGAGGGNPLVYFYNQAFAPKGLLNPFGFVDPELRTIAEQGLESDEPEQFWKEATRRMTSEAYVIPMSLINLPFYVSDEIGGVEYETAGFLPFATAWHPK